MRKLAESVPIQESAAKMGVQADTIDEDDEDVPGMYAYSEQGQEFIKTKHTFCNLMYW